MILAKDFKGLLEKVEKDLVTDPESPIYWTMKGYALSELGSKKEALEALGHALELDNSFIYAHSNIAVVLVELGHWEEAIKHCDAILEIEPRDHIDFLKAIALFELERMSEAEECLRKDIKSWEDWLSENPDAPKEEQINAYFWLINNCHTLEEYEKELIFFDKMWELLPTPMPSHASEYREELVRLAENGGKTSSSVPKSD